MKKICFQCLKEKDILPSRKYCSRECYRIAIRSFNPRKGIGEPNKRIPSRPHARLSSYAIYGFNRTLDILMEKAVNFSDEEKVAQFYQWKYQPNYEPTT